MLQAGSESMQSLSDTICTGFEVIEWMLQAADACAAS